MAQRLVFEVTVNGQSALWATDGTADGTVLLVQTLRNSIAPMGNLGPLAVFHGDNGEPWVTDGTPAGTRELADVNPGLFASFPQALGVADGRLYFVAQVGASEETRYEIWWTDGVTASFTGDLATATRIPFGTQSVLIGTTLVYTGIVDGAGWELCAYDTTGGDSFLLRDLRSDTPTNGSYPNFFTLIGDRAVFSAEEDGTGMRDLWVTDGTAAGTIKLRDGVGLIFLAALPDRAVFLDRDPANASALALFVTDGTVAGTRLLQDGLGSGSARDVEVVGDLVFYSIDDGVPGGDLWVTDGIDRMEKVADFSNGAGSLAPTQLTAFGDRVFFFANPDGAGYHLYASDGTAGGTTVVADTGSPAGPMAVVGQTLVFFHVVAGRTEVWQTDGTAAGTTRLDTPINAIFPYFPQLYGVLGAAVIEGTPDDDTLEGTDGDDSIDGLSGNDRLDGRAGDDTMTGGLGDDTYVVDSAGDVVTETTAAPEDGGIDTVRSRVNWTLGANVENLVLTAAGLSGIGNALDNAMAGIGGAQSLTGGAGDDTLDGGAGADRLSGGDGDDTYIVDNAGDRVFEVRADLAIGGRDQVIAGVTFTLGANLEDLTITADGATGRGNALANEMGGGDGAQTLRGLGGDDVLRGEDGDDVLAGGDDADTLVGGRGADTLLGEAGVDTVDYAAEVEVTGATQGVAVDLRDGTATDPNGGRDRISQVEFIIGTRFADRFTANAGLLSAVVLEGLGGDDEFVAPVADTIISDRGLRSAAFVGGEGNDTFRLGTSNVLIMGGGGLADHLDASTFDLRGFEAGVGLRINLEAGTVTYLVEGSGRPVYAQMSEVERVTGTARADQILGNDANNLLAGGLGRDVIDGGAGNDTVLGGGSAHVDFFIDSAGNDLYRDGSWATLTYERSETGVTVSEALSRVTGQGSDTLDGVNGLILSDHGDRFEAGGFDFSQDGLLNVNQLDMAGGDDIFVQSRVTFEGAQILDALDNGGALSGGAGNDTADYSAISLDLTFLGPIFVRPSSDYHDVFDRGHWFWAVGATPPEGKNLAYKFLAFENFIAGSGDDTFRQYFYPTVGAVSDNMDNRVEGRGGADTFVNLFGNDTILGGTGRDHLLLEAGQVGTRALELDLATGAARFARFVLQITEVEDVTTVGGNDTLRGDEVANRFRSGAGADLLEGGGGDDTLDGGDGSDTADFGDAGMGVVVDLLRERATGQGNDRLIAIENALGSAFDDRFVSTTAANRFDGRSGSDTVDYRAATAALRIDLQAGSATGHGSDRLVGVENAIGGQAGDALLGSTSNNRLEGGAGNDTLIGREGRDTLVGGLGADSFSFTRRDAIDVVTDFRPIDDVLLIDKAMFVALGATLLDGPILAADFRSGVNPVADRAAQFLYDTATGLLRFDADGAGGADAVSVLRLENRAALTFADIVII